MSSITQQLSLSTKQKLISCTFEKHSNISTERHFEKYSAHISIRLRLLPRNNKLKSRILFSDQRMKENMCALAVSTLEQMIGKVGVPNFDLKQLWLGIELD